MNTNNVRRTFTDLQNPQQMRELNRQLEWIWKQLLGGLTEKALSSAGKTQITRTVEQDVIRRIEAQQIDTDELAAALAQMMVAQIGVARIDLAQIVDTLTENLVFSRGSGGDLYITHLKATTANLESADIDYSKIKDLSANQAIIRSGIGDELYIDRLAATSATAISATIGNLTLKSSDGYYYDIAVSADGTISTTLVTPTQQEIDAGTMTNGKGIVDTNLPVQTLNAENVFAQSAIIGQIMTTALTADKITAGQALIASASIPVLYTTSIQAIGDSLDLSANQSISLIVGQATQNFVTKPEFNRVVRIDQSGLHVGDNQTNNETLISSDGVGIVINGLEYSRFAANYAKFGNYIIQNTNDGGLVFRLKGGI